MTVPSVIKTAVPAPFWPNGGAACTGSQACFADMMSRMLGACSGPRQCGNGVKCTGRADATAAPDRARMPVARATARGFITAEVLQHETAARVRNAARFGTLLHALGCDFPRCSRCHFVQRFGFSCWGFSCVDRRRLVRRSGVPQTLVAGLPGPLLLRRRPAPAIRGFAGRSEPA